MSIKVSLRGASRVSCLLLAAGKSSRMSGRNKLLLPFAGTSLVRRTAMEVLSINFEEMIAVTGHEADSISSELKDLPLKVVLNKEFESGMHSSIRTGLSNLRKYHDGFFICHSDQPELDSKMLKDMIRVFEEHEGKNIVYLSCQGKTSQPILIPREFAPEILQYPDGDYGCSYLLNKYSQRLAPLEIKEEMYLRDLDTPEDLSLVSLAQHG
ncbi:nucleotidyltransferase family protein [Bdellovibrio sp. HCB274]|uniref:nucleotidyltransferase family protein n=1 Tax=Bdellovibrio sp. HCB274 TaxID=3394361 RepID=UPI0039B4F9DC